MLKILKYSADQGSFSASKNRVDLRIPENSGVYDLSKSYINFNITADAVGSDADAVYATSVGFNESNRNGGANEFIVPPTTAVLIKHCDFVSQSKGRVESIRHCDALRCALAMYEKPKEYLKKDMGNLQSARSEQAFNKFGANELFNVGSIPSRKRSQDIRVDLKDVFGFGVIDSYDTAKFGATKIHLECNFDKLETQESINATNPWNVDYRLGGTDHGVCDAGATNGTGDVQQQTSIVTTNIYSCPEDSPFHVSQLLTITFAATAGGAGQTANVLITSIEHQANGKMKLNFKTSFKALANGDTISAATVVQKALSTRSLTINSVELVAYRRDDLTEGPSEIQWTAYSSDFDTYVPTQNFNKQYYLPANTLNSLIVFPNPIYSQEPVTSYRINLNGEPTTNRDVAVKSGLHYDMLKKSFINMGSSVVDYNEKLVVNNFDLDSDNAYKDTRAIATPVKISSNMTQMGLELTASANLSGQQCIYSQVLRKI